MKKINKITKINKNCNKLKKNKTITINVANFTFALSWRNIRRSNFSKEFQFKAWDRGNKVSIVAKRPSEITNHFGVDGCQFMQCSGNQ